MRSKDMKVYRTYLWSQEVDHEEHLLRTFGVQGKDVYLFCHPEENFSGCISPTHQTDPEKGMCKVFEGAQEVSWPQIQEWATKAYGITKWVQPPFRKDGLVPAYVMEAVQKAMNEEVL